MNNPNGQAPQLQVIGPIGQYHVAIRGYRVPHLTVVPLLPNGKPIPNFGSDDAPQPTAWNLVVGDRYGLRCAPEVFSQFVTMLANSMAYAAGYEGHGPDAVRRNPHGLSAPDAVARQITIVHDVEREATWPVVAEGTESPWRDGQPPTPENAQPEGWAET